MPKTGFKAFVCSFSVSLFAIMAANRAFWHSQPSDTPLVISHKNIALFVKSIKPAKSPVKKIALNTLPDIAPAVFETPQNEPEVILAAAPEVADFQAETREFATASPPDDAVQELVLSDVLYSPQMLPEQPKIEAEPIYQPEQAAKPLLKAPVMAVADASVPIDKEVSITDNEHSSEEKALVLARMSEPGVIPLEVGGDNAAGRKIKIGDTKDFNHVALNAADIPIASMGKTETTAVEATAEVVDAPAEWQVMDDNPWLIAKSRAGGKNQLAIQKSGDDREVLRKALNPDEPRGGIQLASETVKNLIIPIPDEVMADDNLTPQLAYPKTSEDAIKEKVISEEIKLIEQARESLDKKENLLSPLPDEDIDLEAPDEDRAIVSAKETVKNPTQDKEKAKEKSSIMDTLGAIFSGSTKPTSTAKERAIARVKANRSRRRQAVTDKPVSIMPTEIKLSFQPNRAEISGQTLRWVQAFASKAAENSSARLEIRIDGSVRSELQQKRLNLLHNILTNKGVEYNKINTVFTSRDPNSFILRSTANNSSGKETEKKAEEQPKHIQW